MPRGKFCNRQMAISAYRPVEPPSGDWVKACDDAIELIMGRLDFKRRNSIIRPEPQPTTDGSENGDEMITHLERQPGSIIIDKGSPPAP